MPRERIVTKRGNASYEDGVIHEECPTCKQPDGRRCLNMNGVGLFSQTAHASRIKAAAERRANGNQDVLRTEDVSDASNASS